ncbi:hypothetical protein M9458_028376, partial [Cirrhinus mrigala]
PLWPWHFLGQVNRPGILVHSRLGSVHVRTAGPAPRPFRWHSIPRCTLPGPMRMPARAQHFNNGGDEASFTSGVPHHMPPDLAVLAPLLSHMPTPVGNLVKGGDYGRGDDRRTAADSTAAPASAVLL